ncbi:MAG: NAD+ synthase [Alistipes sp.]|nr:NAD+ synthase [Alistipes sp.]
MKIALAQLNYTIGDIAGNTAKIIIAVERAKAEGADVVLFAEQALSGTPAFDLLRKTTFLELCDEALDEIASYCNGITAVVGAPVLMQNGSQSAAVVIEDGRIKRYITKANITARREMGFLSSGEGVKVVRIAGEKVAIVVGDDFSHLKEVENDVDIIFSINARRYGKGLMSYRYETMHNLAFVESKTIVLVNQVGGSGEIVYDGTSCVINDKGDLALLMKSFQEDFAIYDTLAENKPCELPKELERHERTGYIYNAAVLGLRDYFVKNGYKKACVGLSGGIDSAVVTCIAVEALGKENVKVLLMPSQFSTDHSVTDAKAFAESVGVEYSVLPISEAYTSIVNTLKPAIGGHEFDATEENIQARLRTIMLMAVQNKKGYVALNSSNKSENALGMCTLYGDTAGAFSVTGDLYKTEMFDVARYINKLKGNIIPESILEKEPSSELRPGQKDSDDLPKYEVVDAILMRMIEQVQHREEIINAGFDSEVVEKIHSMVMQNEKKRYQFPPVLRLSACAFGHERLMPLINKYGD